MMGLDDMGEMEIPDNIFNDNPRGPTGMTEEQMMAAAIQASLNEMTLQEQQQPAAVNQNEQQPTASNGDNNQISKESYDFLSEYAGVKPAQEEVKVDHTSVPAA